MTQMLDCLVSYVGPDDPADFRRYFCYRIVAGPGPTPDAGMAVITTVAGRNDTQRGGYRQTVHKAKTGGPAAAVAAAVRYLDAYHDPDHLWKMQSEMRPFANHSSTTAVRRRAATVTAGAHDL